MENGPISRDPDVVARRILDAAEAEFRAVGYEAASTNRITAAFGGSKATLFRHFATKLDLIEAVVQRIAERWEGNVAEPTIEDADPRRWLIIFTTRTLQWILGDDPLFIGRLAIAEGHVLPGMVQIFHMAAGLPLEQILAAKLMAWTGEGQLDCTDAEADAKSFIDLAVSGAVSRALYGDRSLQGSALHAHAEHVVGLFLDGRSAPRT